ncbi:MAG: hypothetical protein IPJ78_04455 [Gemmatimonadetes bacterium]|nr:hypothetical protein [Gemmatimonadota bacterium]
MRQLLRALLGIIGLTLGYAWFLSLAYYLLARPDWGPDTSGFRRGIPMALLICVQSTRWLLGRYAPELPLLRYRGTFLVVAIIAWVLLVAYGLDIAASGIVRAEMPVLLGAFFDLAAVALLGVIAIGATRRALDWHAEG